ncbi:MAG: response regulator transcription factor [Myxococcota bacterium]
MRHVLIADDEARIREVVQYALEKEGFRVTGATDGLEALELGLRERLDLIVLDVTMPGMDGLEVCRRIRAESSTPILFLSAKGEEIDRVLGLEIGGDDYLTKPFSPRELVARVRAILRRSDDTQQRLKTRVLSYGPVRIDPERHETLCNDQPIKLTATEFGVLHALFERPGVVLSRAQLMQRAYAYDNLVTERTIDTHVRRIRAKFRSHDVDPIETVHGVGYKAAEL